MHGSDLSPHPQPSRPRGFGALFARRPSGASPAGPTPDQAFWSARRLSAAVAVVGFAFAARSLWLAYALSTPVPTEDQWEFVRDLVRLRDGVYTWRDLIAQQNEHRIVTARISYFIDYYFFHLGNLSVVLTNYAMLALLAALLAGLAARRRAFPIKMAAFALTLAMLWSVAGWINLGWAFQIQWAYVHLFPALASTCFAAAALRRGGVSYLALAMACAFDALGAFSMASGLCTIAPVLALAVWLRARPALVGVFCLWHAAVVAAFLWGFQAPTQPLVADPVRVMRYMAPYLGTLLPDTKRGAILLGDAGIALFLAAALAATWVSLVRGRRVDAPTAALLAVAVFAVAEGVATAFGRAGMGTDATTMALRYGTPSEVFWSALALAAWRASWLSGSAVGRGAVSGLALCGVVATNTTGGASQSWADWTALADNVGFNLVGGAWTGPSTLLFYPQADTLLDGITLLRDQQLGPFAEAETRFRAPVNALSGIDLSRLGACIGVTEVWDVDDNRVAHVQGWAVSPGVARSPTWLMVFGRGDKLLDYAETWQRRDVPRDAMRGGIALGYDTWFHLDPAENRRSAKLVMVFPGGRVPPCLAPAFGGDR